VRLLVLTSEPVNAEMVRAAVGEEAEGAEVMVVSPALHDSPLRFWISDDDEAIAKAQQVQEETVERLEEEGMQATGDTGEADPLTALQDALATYEADRIVVFSHPGEEAAYREDDVAAEAERRFGLPVVHSTISR
jgi:hypothetical protein